MLKILTKTIDMLQNLTYNIIVVKKMNNKKKVR